MSKSRSDLRLEQQVKQLIVSALIITAEEIINSAEQEGRELTDLDRSTVAGILRNVERVAAESEAIGHQLAEGQN
jgi:uncharacterized protein YicC (UPF0701 family)